MNSNTDLELCYLPVGKMLFFPLRMVPIFVCVEVLQPSQPNRVVSFVVSLPGNTFTGQA